MIRPPTLTSTRLLLRLAFITFGSVEETKQTCNVSVNNGYQKKLPGIKQDSWILTWRKINHFHAENIVNRDQHEGQTLYNHKLYSTGHHANYIVVVAIALFY